MALRALRIASLAVLSVPLPVIVFVNIFVGNTLSSLGFLMFIMGLLLAINGVFFWVFCGLVERYAFLNPFGLYLVYGGLVYVVLGVICIVLTPIIHSFGPPWVFPD